MTVRARVRVDGEGEGRGEKARVGGVRAGGCPGHRGSAHASADAARTFAVKSRQRSACSVSMVRTAAASRTCSSALVRSSSPALVMAAM